MQKILKSIFTRKYSSLESFIANEQNDIAFKFYSKNKQTILDFYKSIEGRFFNPVSICTDKDYTTDFYQHIESSLNSHISAMCASNIVSEYFFTGRKKHFEGFVYYFNWFIPNDQSIFNFIFEQMSINLDVYSATLSNSKDQRWQSETSISHYEINDIQHFFKTKIRIDTYNRHIDTHKHYGRVVFFQGITLVPGYLCWFGDIKQYFPGILNLQNISELQYEELSNGLIKVQLCKKIDEEYSKLRNLQKKYLQTTGWNQLKSIGE